jgi:hypothetical protein
MWFVQTWDFHSEAAPAPLVLGGCEGLPGPKWVPLSWKEGSYTHHYTTNARTCLCPGREDF